MYTAFSAGAIGIDAAFEEELRLADEFGFEGVYIDPAWVLKKGAAAVKKTLERLDIRPAGWNLPVPFSYKDEAKFEASLERLAEAARSCADVGARRTSSYVLPFSDERPFERQFEFLKVRLRRICEVLVPHGTRLGLEFIGPQTMRRGHRYEFIHTMDGMLELCTAVGTGNVGLLLDCWHLYTSGETMERVLELSGRDIVNVHINDAPAGTPRAGQVDSVRALPGETGVIDTTGFLSALNEIGYTGPVMAEPFSKRVNAMPPREAAQATAKAIRKVWPL